MVVYSINWQTITQSKTIGWDDNFKGTDGLSIGTEATGIKKVKIFHFYSYTVGVLNSLADERITDNVETVW